MQRIEWCVTCLVLAVGLTAQEKVRVDSHVAVKMRDGVNLYADIYRPAREGKFPVMVTRTPYGTQRDGVHAALFHFAERGYVVVNQDVRGRFESDGKWTPFTDEGKDGYDTIEWAAKQPWSNGRVGSFGGSYLGNNQWLAGAGTPPSLLAMFPAVASTSIYHNWAYFGGAFRLSFNFGWGVVRMPHRIMQPQTWHTGNVIPADMRYDYVLRGAPLGEMDLKSSGSKVAHYRDWMQHETYDTYWKAASVEDRFDKIKVPVHTFGGWWDIFLAGTINGYVGMKSKGARMVVGPWGHGASQKYGEIDFGPGAMRNLFDYELRWFDRWLKNEQNGVDKEPPVEIYYMGANQWRKEADWPIPGTDYKSLYLTADRGLSFDRPAAPGDLSYVSDPENPVPTLGGNNCCGTPTIAGPVDQRKIESRADVLSYTSPAMTEPLTIAGPVKMTLHAATDGPDTDWMVKLVDVAPNGYAMNIAEGILRARFREGLDRVRLLKPGQTYEFTVDMVGTANVFLPGHKIRVDIMSSNFPQFSVNPNTGDPLATAGVGRKAKNTIFHGGMKPSAIVLPVVKALP
ncbi:MAG: CocE/NonD family hydrolase [Acidobacteria bacterium]|nr:CocE/NonD family hydrolase [Acidobacteriota bacterium]